jgi:hypothetical protein
LCISFFLKTSFLNNLDFRCCLGSNLCCSYFDHCSEIFVFFLLLRFVVDLCAP